MLNEQDKAALRELLQRNGARSLMAALAAQVEALARHEDDAGNRLRACALGADAKAIARVAPRMWSQR